MCEICSELTIDVVLVFLFFVNFEQNFTHCSDVFIVNFDQVNADLVRFWQGDRLQ